MCVFSICLCAHACMYIFVFLSVRGEITEKESNKRSVCVCFGVRERDGGQGRGEEVCVGGKDSATEGKSDWGLKVLRLRVLGLRSEDIIVMFCFH